MIGCQVAMSSMGLPPPAFVHKGSFHILLGVDVNKDMIVSVKVLRPTRHKINHFKTVFPANLLAQY